MARLKKLVNSSPDAQDGRLELWVREKAGQQHQELEGPPLHAAQSDHEQQTPNDDRCSD
jgi:hypothetical protein